MLALECGGRATQRFQKNEGMNMSNRDREQNRGREDDRQNEDWGDEGEIRHAPGHGGQEQHRQSEQGGQGGQGRQGGQGGSRGGGQQRQGGGGGSTQNPRKKK
jgi:hypothetical protein